MERPSRTRRGKPDRRQEGIKLSIVFPEPCPGSVSGDLDVPIANRSGVGCRKRGNRRLAMAPPATLVAQLHEAGRSHGPGRRRQVHRHELRLSAVSLDRRRGKSKRSKSGWCYGPSGCGLITIVVARSALHQVEHPDAEPSTFRSRDRSDLLIFEGVGSKRRLTGHSPHKTTLLVGDQVLTPGGIRRILDFSWASSRLPGRRHQGEAPP